MPSAWLSRYPAGRRRLPRWGLTEEEGDDAEEEAELWLPWRCWELWRESG